MSARMQVPLSQRRHTNIAVVRYAKNGVKLEIACYKNKVISYRSGTETRLDEVLQVERIFVNVARGKLASEKEVETVFGTDMTEKQAIKFMLDHGELQVAQQERTAEVDEIFKDVAVIISQKCINTKTQHPFPSQVIEQALRSIGAAVKLDQPVKKQALGLIRSLIEADIIPIARANMKIRCTTSSTAAVDKLRTWCKTNDAEPVEADPAMNTGPNANSLLFLIQPHLFRDLDVFVREELPTGSTLHMVDAAVTDVGEGEGTLDANAVSHANAQHGDLTAGGDSTPGAVSSSAGTGGGRRGGKGGRCGIQKADSSDECEEGEDEPGTAAHADGAASDLTAELQKLRLNEEGDDSHGGSRGGKGKRANKKKNATATDAPTKKGKGSVPSDEDEDSDDGGGRKGKNKRVKKKKAAAVALEKPEPEVEEAFSESDEELMVNRKQRAKKQHQEAQQDANNWDDEEDFDYGEEEEEEKAQA